jgi:hypothetical protein
MESNGVGTQTQNLQVAPQAQVVQQQSAVQHAGTSFMPVNPGANQTQTPAPQQTQQQADGLLAVRQQIAQATGYSLDQVPNDPQTISKIVLGGLGAQRELERMRGQQPAPQQTPAPASPQQQLQQVAMPPGWEQMVTFDAEAQAYKPTHQAFGSVAQMANQNYAASRMRQNVVQSGNLLPEHEQKIQSLVEQQVNARLEKQRQDDFIASHGPELFEHENGQKKTQWNPMTGKQEPVMSQFGQAFNEAADELLASGAQFASQHQLAQLAYKIAKDRTKANQPVQQPQQGFQQQVPQHGNPDLEALFSSHRQAATQRMTGVNGNPHPTTGNPTLDLRAQLRNALSAAPEVGNGTDFARQLGWNIG